MLAFIIFFFKNSFTLLIRYFIFHWNVIYSMILVSSIQQWFSIFYCFLPPTFFEWFWWGCLSRWHNLVWGYLPFAPLEVCSTFSPPWGWTVLYSCGPVWTTPMGSLFLWLILGFSQWGVWPGDWRKEVEWGHDIYSHGFLPAGVLQAS